MYVPHKATPKYIKQQLIDQAEKIDSNTIIAGALIPYLHQ